MKFLPHLNAALNALSAMLLVSGYLAIRKKKIPLHKGCMLAAFGCSIFFLASYVTHQVWKGGPTSFPGSGAVRVVYFTILISHTALAALVPFFAIATIILALRERFEKHRRLARWTLPIWLYVSVTGVAVYLMLYHLYLPKSE